MHVLKTPTVGVLYVIQSATPGVEDEIVSPWSHPFINELM